MQAAHEDLNDVDDPTKEIATKAKRKFQPRWLKSYSWLDYDQVNNSKKCSLCEYVWLISCERFFFVMKVTPVFEHFFCAVFVILKSTPCLIGKERGIQNMFTSHSGNTNFKLERV